MISLIICSTSAYISPALAHNIENTIGVDYELIIVDNSTNQHSIFEAYNLGLARSKYSISCFMHDDILYRSEDWGKNVLRHFEDSKIGMVGIAGTKYIGRIPAFWSDYADYNVHNLIQSDKHGRTKTHEVLAEKNGSSESTEVVMVDGVWFCVRDMKAQSIKFDESYQGFHFYDLDTCMQVRSKGLQVKVVYDVLLEHFSVGSIGSGWAENIFKCYEKWQANLPASIQKIAPAQLRIYDRQALIKLIKIVDFYKSYQYLPATARYATRVLGLEGLRILFNFRRVFLRGYRQRSQAD